NIRCTSPNHIYTAPFHQVTPSATYSGKPRTANNYQYITNMCCRRRPSTLHSTTNTAFYHTKNDQHQYQQDPPLLQTQPQNSFFFSPEDPQTQCCHPRHYHPYRPHHLSNTNTTSLSMASLLILSLGLGAIKIKEHRDEKKARKAALQDWEDQLTTTTSRGPLGNVKTKVTGRRKRGEGLDGSRCVSGRWEEGVESGGVAPPSYQEVVGERGQGRRA
ncbi:hypothetical protein DM02DRAFT_128320, partial [Periconia macrospinosa]